MLFTYSSIPTKTSHNPKNRRDHDRTTVRFTSTYAINEYYHKMCESDFHSCIILLDKRLCDQICQWLTTNRLFSVGTLVSATNNTDHHDSTEIEFLQWASDYCLAPKWTSYYIRWDGNDVHFVPHQHSRLCSFTLLLHALRISN